MNSSISPEVFVLKGDTALLTTQTMAAAGILAAGTSGFVGDTGVALDVASDPANVSGIAQWNFFSSTGSLPGRMSSIVKNANIRSFTKITYSAPTKQIELLGATLGTAVIQGGSAYTVANGATIYLLCTTGGLMTIGADLVVTNVYAEGTLVSSAIVNNGTFVKNSIYKVVGATANNTIVPKTNGTAIVKQVTENTSLIGVSPTVGDNYGLMIRDNTLMDTYGVPLPNNIKMFDRIVTKTDDADTIVAAIVAKINSGSTVVTASVVSTGLEVIAIQGKTTADKFVVKGAYGLNGIDVVSVQSQSDGRGTTAQIKELIKLGSFNSGGEAGVYELQDKYYSQLDESYALLTSSTGYITYHIRHFGSRINPLGQNEQIIEKDLFLVIENNAADASQVIAKLDALLAKY